MFKNKLGAQIELLSVHIPKTAGTSFRKTLKEVYGEKAVIRVDLPPKSQVDPEDPFLPLNKRLKSDVRVLHGHYNAARIKEFYPGIPADVRMITWVRDPVNRVISNYYYLRQRIREEIDKSPTLNIGITNRMVKTLMEYAIQDVARDRMSKFLAGTAVEDFIFVGVQEHYTEDLRYLAKLLEWKSFTEYHHNVTEDKYSEISDEIKAEIRALNQADWELYRHALELSAQRRSAKV